MNKILFSILLVFCGFCLLAQENEKPETVPLEEDIEIRIISIDSTSLEAYEIYEFIYQDEKKDVMAKFWSSTSDKTFEIGKVTVKLCRIVQMKTDEGFSLRGCAFYNGFFLSKNDSTQIYFDFDEYGESPTLRHCTTD